MLSNLKAEMARADVKLCAVAEVIGKGERTVRERIKGNGYFSVPEAIAVRDTFFPGISLEYLFARTETAQASAKDSA